MKNKFVTLYLAFGSVAIHAQGISAGSDVIDKAVLRIVPPPYEVIIDPAIPPSLVLRWSKSGDWLLALREATDAAGVRAVPRFDQGRIEILPIVPKPKVALVATPAVAAATAVASSAVARVAVIATEAVQPTLPAPQTVLVAQAPIKAASVFSLKPGIRIDIQMMEWAKKDGWELLWKGDKSWILPGASDVVYSGSVDVAVESAVKDLYSNGIPVQLHIWEKNKMMEISHAQ